jgi:hypothetical protein
MKPRSAISKGTRLLKTDTIRRGKNLMDKVTRKTVMHP